MKLPNGERSEISRPKLTDYCLNLDHPSGKHKARVFQSVLGIRLENADVLEELIRRAAVEGEVIQQATTQKGEQLKVDWTVPDTEGIKLRTIWEITSEIPNPRLISAFLRT